MVCATGATTNVGPSDDPLLVVLTPRDLVGITGVVDGMAGGDGAEAVAAAVLVAAGLAGASPLAPPSDTNESPFKDSIKTWCKSDCLM